MSKQPSPNCTSYAHSSEYPANSIIERMILFFAQTRAFEENQSSQIISKNTSRLNAALFFLLVILVFATAFTDNGFLSLEFGSTTVMCMLILTPLTIGAFLFKPLRAFIFGLIAGIVIMLHGLLMPTAYYEFFLLSPLNSFVLIPLVTTLLSALFGKILSHTSFMQPKRILAMAIVCLISSFLFLGLFLITTYFPKLEFFKDPLLLIATIELLGGPFWAQALINTVAILLPCFLIDAIIYLWKRNSTHSLRGIFSTWLFVLIASSFMLTGTICYIAITFQCEATAEKKLDDQSNYLETALIEGTLDTATLANFHPGNNTGSVILGKNDVVEFSYNNEMIGSSFKENLSLICLTGNPEDILNSHMLWHAYINDSSNETLNSLGNNGLWATEVTEPDATYEIALTIPMDEIYAERASVMLWILIVTLFLFGGVYLLTMQLIKKIVVDSFTATNKTLKEIENGNLDERLTIQTTNEFSALSNGINATVESLQYALQNVKKGYERELSAARTIQHSSLPQTFPAYPDLPQFDLFATMDTAREVGGDFYDFFLLETPADSPMKPFDSSTNANRLAFVIADVSGKGMPAALFMMAAKNEIRNSLQSKASLVEAVESANQHLCEDNASQMFVTAFIALFNFETGEIEFVNAGHNPPLLFHNSSWTYLREKSGVFLGAFNTAPYQTHTITLEQGDALFLYTDGVTEAMNTQEHLFGEERLKENLNALSTNTPQALIRGIKEPLAHWMSKTEQTDDITMLAVRFNSPRETRETNTVFPATIDALNTVLSFIDSALNEHNCPSTTRNQLKVCVEELFVNVAHYAYPSNDEENPGLVRIEIQTQLATKDEIKTYGKSHSFDSSNKTLHKTVLSISDAGIAFNPLEKEAPTQPETIADATIGGLGIFLAKTIADSITYKRSADINTISIIKYW